MHPMECKWDAGRFRSHFTILKCAEYLKSNVVKSSSSWEMFEQLLFKDEFYNSCSLASSRDRGGCTAR